MILFTTKPNRSPREASLPIVLPLAPVRTETVEDRHIRIDTAGIKRRTLQTKIENELI